MKNIDFKSIRYYNEMDFKSITKLKGGEKMTNTELLEQKIQESGYKKSYIAKAIGLKSTSGLTKKIRNESEFKATEIDILCDLLKINSLSERQKIFFAKW